MPITKTENDTDLDVDDDVDEDIEWDWPAEEAEVVRRVNGGLRMAARLGVLAIVVSMLVARRQVSTDLRVQLLSAALRWADQFSEILAARLTDTTRRHMRDIVRLYIRTPDMTEADLRRLLLSGLGGVARGRALLIAATEITRAYIEGALIAARGLQILREPLHRPPLHVRCRCRLVFELHEDGLLHPIWWTADDEHVCSQCAPLHNKDVSYD